jgi:uncharacterized repeat protein (TIGR01451 family)
MRRIYAITGIGILGACLAGWVALAEGQPSPSPVPVPVKPAADAVAPAPVEAPAAPEIAKAKQAPVPLPPPPPATGAEPVLPSAPESAAPTAPTPAPIPAFPGMAADRGQVSPPVPPTSPQPVRESLPPWQAPPAAGDEKQPESTMKQDNPTGRQEPSVSMEWVGPPASKVGQAGDYTLVVHNTCNIPVQQVLVRVRVPNGMTAAATEPKATTEGNVLVWDLGTMPAKQEKNLQMKLTAESKGDLMPQAWVTFTGTSVMHVKVREPKLVLKASAPEKVLVGDAAAFTLTVTNPGDGSADQVKIHAALSDGLEHARGNKIDFEIGNLAPGEARSVQVICGTKTGGVQKCDATADAECGLKGSDAASVNVIMPRLDLEIHGPGLKYLERKALYTLKVTNPGDAAATNVTVADVVPAGFKVLAASDGGRHDFSTRAVSWFLGEVGPGQTRQVQLEVQAINCGEFTHTATAVGARGLRAESQCLTKVEGLSALMIEMVDTEDPIEVGADTTYEIRITNTGSKTETDIKLVATVPDKMEFKNAQSPVRFREEGKVIVFEPLEKLAPKADAIFRINVKATEAGTVRFKIQVSSTNITEPIIKMEPTRIYDDTPQIPGTPKPPSPAVLPPAPMPPG